MFSTTDNIEQAGSSRKSQPQILLLGLWIPILKTHRPDLACLTAPFAGTCYGALRLGKAVREVLPKAKTHSAVGLLGASYGT